nr:MAG TPA: hypothetical protein [Caudoviricetes sp.]
MSEQVKLADLMKEKMEEEKASEATAAVETTAPAVEEQSKVEEEVLQTVPDPVVPVAPTFDENSLQSADLSALVPSGKTDATQEARDELMDELDNGIADAIERRFKPALEEIHEMRREYEDLKAMGEENPQVVSKYNPELDLNPELTDKDREAIRRDEKEHVLSDEEIKASTSINNLIPEDDIEREFEQYEAAAESSVNNITTAATTTPAINTTTIDVSDAAVPSVEVEEADEDDLLYDDELLEDLGLDEDKEEAERLKEEKQQQRNMEEFARVLRQQLDEVGERKPDISKFRVRKRPVAFTKVLSKPVEKKYYEWGLFATGVSISMTPLSAIEMDEINPYTDSANDIGKARTVFSTLYKHLAPECRNMDMEAWLKLLNYQDLNHLFFALYNANFSTSNIIPFSCPKCKHFYTEKRPIIDMVKFETEADKETFNKIIGKDPSLPPTFEEEIYVANGDYAFGIVIPKIYNSMFEERLLNESFREKYAGIINISHCISTVYEIDEDNEELIPIQFNTAPNDIVKTYKYRIQGIYKILSKLSAYEFKELQSHIAKYLEENSKDINISYQVPAATCPKCGAEIEAIPMNAQELVFTRHRLIHMLD